ncbi:MAG: hypothetical protein JWO48_3670 [Bryobacterales bacterium]|nr:hypothetical protein [Bryobacterales bacterium]
MRADKFDLSRLLRETLSMRAAVKARGQGEKPTVNAVLSREGDATLDGALRPLPWGERAERWGDERAHFLPTGAF